MTETVETRTCPKCRKEINAEATRCVYCFAKSDPVRKVKHAPEASAVRCELDAPTELGTTSTDGGVARVTARPHSDVALSSAASVARRYHDAYIIAKEIVEQGQRLKTLALIAGLGVAVMFLLLGLQLGAKLVVGAVVAGAVIGGLLYVGIHAYGVRVAAEGQHLQAALDVAVNTSPFMTDNQKAKAMSL